MTEKSAIEKMVRHLERMPYEFISKEVALEVARRLAAEEKDKPVVDFAAKYYNEVAKNSVLYDLGAALIEKLEQHDPNDQILEKAEAQLEGNGYSLGRPVEAAAEASLVADIKREISTWVETDWEDYQPEDYKRAIEQTIAKYDKGGK